MNDVIGSTFRRHGGSRLTPTSLARWPCALRSGAPSHLALITASEPQGLWLGDGQGSPARCVRVLRHSVFAARAAGIRHLTLSTFSALGAGSTGVGVLAGMLLELIAQTQRDFLQAGIRVLAIGNIDDLPTSLRHAIEGLCATTDGGAAMTLTLPVAYAARTDIVAAARGVAALIRAGRILPEEITEQFFRRQLTSRALPPVDLAICTQASASTDFLPFELGRATKISVGIPLSSLRPKHLCAAFDLYARAQI